MAQQALWVSRSETPSCLPTSCSDNLSRARVLLRVGCCHFPGGLSCPAEGGGTVNHGCHHVYTQSHRHRELVVTHTVHRGISSIMNPASACSRQGCWDHWLMCLGPSVWKGVLACPPQRQLQSPDQASLSTVVVLSPTLDLPQTDPSSPSLSFVDQRTFLS